MRYCVRPWKHPRPLCAYDSYNSTHSLSVWCEEQTADRPHDVDGANRSDQVFAHAASGQSTIENDVVDPPDDDYPRAGVANFGQLIEPAKNFVGTAISLDQDDIRCGRSAISFNCCANAAHLDFHMRLCQAPVFSGGLNNARGFDRFAKSLDRNRGAGAIWYRRSRAGVVSRVYRLRLAEGA